MSFIEVNGTALRYELSGSGARAVVLIHEMGGTLESFDGAAALLARDRRVLRYDTRGAGLSQKVRGALSIDTMTDDLVALLDALGIGWAALAGVAVGGAIALHAAVRHAARIAAVVATSPLSPSRPTGAPPCWCGSIGSSARAWRSRRMTALRPAIRRSCAPTRCASPRSAPAGSATIL